MSSKKGPLSAVEEEEEEAAAVVVVEEDEEEEEEEEEEEFGLSASGDEGMSNTHLSSFAAVATSGPSSQPASVRSAHATASAVRRSGDDAAERRGQSSS